jgi:phosphoglucosamine mutase
MPKLFGTDGIRGEANSYPMTPEVVLQVGRAVAAVVKAGETPLRVVIGQDTRISGDMIAHALAAGLCSTGADAEMAGVLPTPGVACVTRATGAGAGIVISASHNPYRDNGIKVFGPDGRKLPEDTEARIEELVLSGKAAGRGRTTRNTGRVRVLESASGMYADFLRQCAADGQSAMNGLRVVLDCAHGATWRIAPRVFTELGCNVTALHVRPDGRNINRRCGSQHPEALARKVIATGSDAGLAFDGDGDRLIAVDDRGEVITGDRVLAICARHLQASKRLKNNTVVSTVMSNAGLGRALKKLGIRHVTTPVGDRHVAEAMRAEGAVLGGEDSGHMIFAEHHTTGDGILTALMLVAAMRDEGKPLSKLKSVMTPFPQKLINVPVCSKPELEGVPAIAAVIREVEREMGEDGRVLVRYSGTEPLCRVMVEGPTRKDTDKHCRRIAEVVAKELAAY